MTQQKINIFLHAFPFFLPGNPAIAAQPQLRPRRLRYNSRADNSSHACAYANIPEFLCAAHRSFTMNDGDLTQIT